MKVSYKLIPLFWACLTKQNFTRAMKNFSVATTLLFYCNPKHSDILQFRYSDIVTMINCFQSLTNVTKNSIIDIEEVLDPPVGLLNVHCILTT